MSEHAAKKEPTAWRPEKFLWIFAGVLFSDQLLKELAIRYGAYLENRRALWGLAMDPQLALLILLVFLALLAQNLRTRAQLARFSLPLALLLAGIAGNLSDRLLRGFIVDYIRLGVFAFNLADLAIFAGAGIFIWRIMKE